MAIGQTTFSTKRYNSVRANGINLGDLKWSILTEAQLQAESGLDWRLCDGQSITGTELHTLDSYWTNTPDGRGRALMMLDHSAGVDTDLTTLGGQYDDRTALPSNAFTGTATVNAWRYNQSGEVQSSPNWPYWVTAIDTSHGENDLYGTSTITGGGDSATRPNALGGNLYILVGYSV